jgi:hypothetical protein
MESMSESKELEELKNKTNGRSRERGNDSEGEKRNRKMYQRTRKDLDKKPGRLPFGWL